LFQDLIFTKGPILKIRPPVEESNSDEKIQLPEEENINSGEKEKIQSPEEEENIKSAEKEEILLPEEEESNESADKERSQSFEVNKKENTANMSYPAGMVSQHVSASVSQLMIEQVMKLGSLATDAKFFLMVEDANGQRRVTGDNSLVRSFASGTMRPRDEDLRLELDPNATTGIFEQAVNSIFDVEDVTGNGANKRAADYMDNEFGNAKRAKTNSDNGRAGTNDVEGYDDECNIFVDKLPSSYDEASFREAFAQFGEITRIKLLVDKRTGTSKCNGFILYTTAAAADAAITEMNGKVMENGAIPLYVRKAKENKKNLLQYWPGLQAMANPAIMAMATGRRGGGNNGPGMMGAMPMPGGGMMGNAMGGGPGVGMPPPPPPSQPSNPYAGYTAQGTPGVEGVTKHTLFVYNLSADSSELDLYNLFGKFGAIIDVHLQRDLSTGASKGFGFVAFAEYQQATAAIQGMDGYLYEKNNYKPLQVSFKNRKN